LHYVAGGKGQPLVLLLGWPEAWWEFHKIMPELAKHYHVIAVDLRGMGGSSKPQDGYGTINLLGLPLGGLIPMEIQRFPLGEDHARV
jgi:pimeloyl-ACP methyl ester carboxylesterase